VRKLYYITESTFGCCESTLVRVTELTTKKMAEKARKRLVDKTDCKRTIYCIGWCWAKGDDDYKRLPFKGLCK